MCTFFKEAELHADLFGEFLGIEAVLIDAEGLGQFIGKRLTTPDGIQVFLKDLNFLRIEFGRFLKSFRWSFELLSNVNRENTFQFSNLDNSLIPIFPINQPILLPKLRLKIQLLDQLPQILSLTLELSLDNPNIS